MRASSVWESFGNAFAGLGYVLRTQRNVRIQAGLAAAVVLVGLWLGLPAERWAILALTVGTVLAGEIANTAVEALVDLVSPEYHELAGRVKDVSAAGVLCLAVTAATVGLLILGPPLWERLLS